MIAALEEEEWTPQPSRKLLNGYGACECAICLHRAMKLGAMLSGWDAEDGGRLAICGWCRKRLGLKAIDLLAPCATCNGAGCDTCERTGREYVSAWARHCARPPMLDATPIHDEDDE